MVFSWTRESALDPPREQGVLSIDPPTPFYRLTPQAPQLGRVLVIHGLDASKELVRIFASALADAGFEVYAIDLPGHGDSPVGFTAMKARQAVARSLNQIGDIDVIVGHSLGAGLLLDLANEQPLPRMVLLSPPPTPLGSADLSRTLVVTGAWDIPAINAFAPDLEGAEWWRLSSAAHSTALFNAAQTRDIIRWMGGRPEAIHTAARLGWTISMLGTAIAIGICLLPLKGLDGPDSPPALAEICAWYVLAGAGAVIAVHFLPLTNWLHLFATDYLIAVWFAEGVLLLVTAVYSRGSDRTSIIERPAQPERGRKWATVLVGGAAAAYTIGIVGFVASGHLLHFALSSGRWWRFMAISIASLPLFLFDEFFVRAGPGWRTAITGILTRALIGSAVLTGALTLNRESAFLVIVTHLLVLFWIALWFLTGLVRRHTRDPWAASLFACLVQGWIFAAWFINT
jgi:pimeloyl-ACP methyl ester carboxylesterase